MDKKLFKNKLQNAIGSNNAKTVSIILLMVFIAVGYVFFFNTTKIFGENYDYTISKIGDVITLENGHTVSLTRSDIDSESNCIEFEFYFQNSNYDGYNDYNIDIRSTSKTGKISDLETETICSDSDVYVVRAKLPKAWNAVVADITLKNKDDLTLEAKFYSNTDSLYHTIIKGNSREYFLKLDTKRNIERLSDEIISLQGSNAELEKKILEIDTQAKSLQERMTYMTVDDLEEAQTTISNMSSERESSLKQIDDNKKLISEYTNTISKLQNEINK